MAPGVILVEPTAEVARVASSRQTALPPPFRFHSLVLTEPHSLVGSRSSGFTVSMGLHLVMLALILLVPLLGQTQLPQPPTLRGFFVTPADVAPPPPPPPPPAPAAARPRANSPKPVSTEPPKFVAPVEVPQELRVEPTSIDLGVEGGVEGGVPGGVPGGVVGGIVGGLPQEKPAEVPPVVRVGGQIKAPTLVHRVEPEYPTLALQARATALLILEAQVDTRGYVRTVRVLRGHPLFDEAAVAAVKQWRYQPLLLNGTETAFILTVTLNFALRAAPGQSPPGTS